MWIVKRCDFRFREPGGCAVLELLFENERGPRPRVRQCENLGTTLFSLFVFCQLVLLFLRGESWASGSWLLTS